MTFAHSNGPMQGKVAFIAGATSGIGEAAAREFAAQGAKVVVTGRRSEKGKGVRDAITAASGEAIYAYMDVLDDSSILSALQLTLRTFGRLDMAFNNAGISGAQARLEDQSDEAWDAVFDINVRAQWRLLKRQIPMMRQAGGGSIVLNASIFGLVGSGIGVGPYVASKHALVGLTKAASLECAADGVRVNAICPGFAITEMLDPAPRARERIEAVVQRDVPLKRLADAAEVARAAVWLCSDQASFLTGQAIAVDGGWTTR